MADMNQNDASPVGKASLLDSVTKFAAVLGSLVALGQAASTWIEGMYKAATEQEKTQREVALADIKERSKLAESYLHLILAKETPIDGRAILFSALGELEGHPLRTWARQRYELYMRYNSELSEAYKAQSEAAQHANKADGLVNSLEAEIATLNVQIKQNMDNPEKAADLQQHRIAKSSELAKARAVQTVAVVTVEAAQATIGRSARSDPTILVPVTNLAAAITSLSGKVDVALLKSIFPEGAGKNIEDSVQYLQAALQEFKISDPRMVATIVGTIAVETPNFEAYEESATLAARYEGRANLGNTEPGDGVKFRGRGYLGLTGRANYRNMSERLGLGTRLVDAPDDAKSPEVASRVLVAWFVDRQERFLPALDRNDFTSARRLVAGAPTRVKEFEAAYRKVIENLVDTKVPAAPSRPG